MKIESTVSLKKLNEKILEISRYATYACDPAKEIIVPEYVKDAEWLEVSQWWREDCGKELRKSSSEEILLNLFLEIIRNNRAGCTFCEEFISQPWLEYRLIEQFPTFSFVELNEYGRLRMHKNMYGIICRFK